MKSTYCLVFRAKVIRIALKLGDLQDKKKEHQWSTNIKKLILPEL